MHFALCTIRPFLCTFVPFWFTHSADKWSIRPEFWSKFGWRIKILKLLPSGRRKKKKNGQMEMVSKTENIPNTKQSIICLKTWTFKKAPPNFKPKPQEQEPTSLNFVKPVMKMITPFTMTRKTGLFRYWTQQKGKLSVCLRMFGLIVSLFWHFPSTFRA